MTNSFFKMNLFTAKSLACESYADKTYEILETSGLSPDVFDVSEPIRKSWTSRGGFVDAWKQQSKNYYGQVLFQRMKDPAYYGGVTFRFGPDRKLDNKPPFHGLSIYSLKESECRGDRRSRFIELGDRLFDELEMDYGFICLNDEYDAKNIVKDVHHSDGTLEPRKVVGMNWPYCLPGLYWINYFGRRYLEQGFAKNLLIESPGTVEVIDNGVRLQSGDDPHSYASNEAWRTERKTQQVLGASWFFDRESNRTCRSLNVSLEPLRMP